MTDVLAVLEGGASVDEAVCAVANALAPLLRAHVKQTRVDRAAPMEGEAQLVAAVQEPAVAAAVVTVDEEPDAACWQIMRAATRPVVAVPRGATRPDAAILRVLVPLDGTATTAVAVRGPAERLQDGGAELVAVHVFDPTTVPSFSDQAAHHPRPWKEEFLRRAQVPVRGLDIRVGDTAPEVLAAAASSHADLILLAWGQDLDEGRARTVRDVLLTGDVPVMLVPVVHRTAPGEPIT